MALFTAEEVELRRLKEIRKYWNWQKKHNSIYSDYRIERELKEINQKIKDFKEEIKMITMLKYYKLQNMEDELERLETKILNSKGQISRYDLQELEGLSNKIMALRLEMSGVNVKEVA